MNYERPVFVPTREQRNQVCMMVTADYTLTMISKDLGISKTILKRHFKDELENGKEQVRKRAIFTLQMEAFKTKGTPGLKAVIVLSTETTPPKLPDEAPKEPTMRLGRKVVQKIEAEEANAGLYATPAAPSRLKTFQ